MGNALPVIPATLPCSPCPHKNLCCSYGTALYGDEPAEIRKHHGEASVIWDEEEQELRTAVIDGKCIFLVDEKCSIHEAPYYPKVCRGFPWTLADTGEPYPYTLEICPEIEDAPE